MIFAEIFSYVGEQLQNFDISTAVAGLFAVFVIYVFSNEIVRYRARISGLGGPKGLPMIGNLWDIRINAAEKYRQWAKKHGDVYQIQLGNIPVVLVNSAASAKEIFSHHSQALASRPEFYTFHKVCSCSSRNILRITVLISKIDCFQHSGNYDWYFSL
jgi:3-hydroxyphenylacetate 6-hydroxylase